MCNSIDKQLKQIKMFNGGEDVSSFPVKFIAKYFGDEDTPRREVIHEFDYSENEQFRELRSTSCYKADELYPSFRHVDATKQTYDVYADRITEQQFGVQFYRSITVEEHFSIHYLEFSIGDKTYCYKIHGLAKADKPNEFVIKIKVNGDEVFSFTKEIKNSHNFNLHKNHFVKMVTNEFTKTVKSLLSGLNKYNNPSEEEFANIFQHNNIKLHLEERLDWTLIHS